MAPDKFWFAASISITTFTKRIRTCIDWKWCKFVDEISLSSHRNLAKIYDIVSFGHTGYLKQLRLNSTTLEPYFIKQSTLL